jgi:CRP-like cAMP-binding protein
MAGGKSDSAKTFRKGEILFKRGEPATHLYIVQSGLVSVSMNSSAPAGRTEIYQATAPQVVGLEALGGVAAYEYNAIAMNETQVLAMPIHVGKDILSRASFLLSLIMKAFMRKYARTTGEVGAIKLAGDAMPCPPECVPKLFSTLFHVVSYTGKRDKEWFKVEWAAFRRYCTRVFLESPVRLEQALYMLQTLGYARLEMVKDENDEDELGFVHFTNVEDFEGFSDFMRKRGKELRSDSAVEANDPCLQAGEVLLRVFGSGAGQGAAEIKVPYNRALETLEVEMGRKGIDLAYLKTLMASGLPIRIIEGPPEKHISFVPTDIKRLFRFWKIMTRLGEWNKTGRAPGAPELTEEQQKANKRD